MSRGLTFGAVWFVCCTVPVASAAGGELERVRREFAEPSRHYRSAPLWVWNDLLTEEQVVSTLRDLAGQGLKQAFVHPRPGLMTPYLSNDWFRLWRTALREAERLDMNLWIYDENSYPSGFAGGLVPDAMPESRGKGVVFQQTASVPEPGDEVLAVYRLARSGYEKVTAEWRAGKKLPRGKYLVASIRLAPRSPWFGGRYYVDLLKPGVTEKVIELTHEAYRKHIGEQFGKRVPGIFTDEPHLTPAGGLHWSDHLPELFKQRWGYDLIDALPSLVRHAGDWKRVRHNYQQLLLEQFIEHWSKPNHDYCHRYGLEWTGHYWEHGWPGARHGPDNMAMYAWHQRPGIDILMNLYSEDVDAQFGNVRSVVELASVANQLGKKRTLCETYGAGGWDLRFEDMKRIGDWVFVLGVNTMDEHLSFITIRGARKRDHPQSFSYHEPWWEAYHLIAHYFARLSVVLSAGEQINSILLLEPTTTAWMYQGDPELGQLGRDFQALVTELAQRQVEFDLGCEDIIARHGSVAGPYFVIGRRRYNCLVLPPWTENLNSKTFELLEAYLKAGGTLLSCSAKLPERIDGRPSAEAKRLASYPGYKRVKRAELAELLLRRSEPKFAIEHEGGILYHQRRQLEEGQFLLLVNTSSDQPCRGTVQALAKGVERWDPRTGRTEPATFERDGERVDVPFSLQPCGSLLLFLSERPCEPARPTERVALTCQPKGQVQVRRIGPNVLTLDYLDLQLGKDEFKGIYFYDAAERIFKHNGLQSNPWEQAVQFKDELLKLTFPQGRGFEATYKFLISGRVPRDLRVVVERPDIYKISINGQPIEPVPGRWWLDRSFGVLDVSKLARVGENEVTLRREQLTIYHELEPIYLLGSFRLEPAERGFIIVPDQPAGYGPWNKQGHPFHAAGFSYRAKFDVPEPVGRFLVVLNDWYGSVAKVQVNDKLAGYIAYRPWECEVTQLIRPGENEVEVAVIGTLRNTLGPHHIGPQLGAAWPHMFYKAPKSGPPAGLKYDTVGYGLMKPFELRQLIAK